MNGGENLAREVIVVTGGKGLVGRAIQTVIQKKSGYEWAQKKTNEEWVFLGSKDGDLRLVKN